MMTFEAAFEVFLEQYSYDKAQEALFHLARQAFEAGWRAGCKQSGISQPELRPTADIGLPLPQGVLPFRKCQ